MACFHSLCVCTLLIFVPICIFYFFISCSFHFCSLNWWCFIRLLFWTMEILLHSRIHCSHIKRKTLNVRSHRLAYTWRWKVPKQMWLKMEWKLTESERWQMDSVRRSQRRQWWRRRWRYIETRWKFEINVYKKRRREGVERCKTIFLFGKNLNAIGPNNMKTNWKSTERNNQHDVAWLLIHHYALRIEHQLAWNRKRYAFTRITWQFFSCFFRLISVAYFLYAQVANTDSKFNQ